LDVTLDRDAAALHLDYRLRGDLSLLLLPSPQEALDPDRLWAHTCCEIFLAQAASPAYREYNFSPSGQWAAYAFSAYRQRTAWKNPPAPRMSWQREKNVLRLRVTLPAAALPAVPLQAALAVVVLTNSVFPDEQFAPSTSRQTLEPACAYYALRHPPGAPDFHHRANFILHLD
jgi:hypothetical protein